LVCDIRIPAPNVASKRETEGKKVDGAGRLRLAAEIFADQN